MVRRRRRRSRRMLASRKLRALSLSSTRSVIRTLGRRARQRCGAGEHGAPGALGTGDARAQVACLARQRVEGRVDGLTAADAPLGSPEQLAQPLPEVLAAQLAGVPGIVDADVGVGLVELVVEERRVVFVDQGDNPLRLRLTLSAVRLGAMISFDIPSMFSLRLKIVTFSS